MLENEIHHQIALWGPSSSGKTWLIHSFARTLDKLNISNSDFKYEITDIDGLSITVQPPTKKPTQDPQDTIWHFRRVPRKNTKQHVLSAQSHIITVLDNRGESTIRLNDQLTKVTIGDSDYIMLMLDPTLLDEFHISTINQMEEKGGEKYDKLLRVNNGESKLSYEKIDYVNIVKKVLDLLAARQESQKPYVAICISKIDLLGVHMREPWTLIKMFFGDDMYHCLQNYESIFVMQTFAVSSAGFLPSSGRQSNFNPGTGEIKDLEGWTPYNVEAPFFWLFENLEKDGIKKRAKGLTGLFFREERLKSYMPYKYNRK